MARLEKGVQVFLLGPVLPSGVVSYSVVMHNYCLIHLDASPGLGMFAPVFLFWSDRIAITACFTSRSLARTSVTIPCQFLPSGPGISHTRRRIQP